MGGRVRGRRIITVTREAASGLGCDDIVFGIFKNFTLFIYLAGTEVSVLVCDSVVMVVYQNSLVCGSEW